LLILFKQNYPANLAKLNINVKNTFIFNKDSKVGFCPLFFQKAVLKKDDGEKNKAPAN
jgi:hypothetical protein